MTNTAQKNNRLKDSEKDNRDSQSQTLKPVDDAMGYLHDYVRKNPEQTALWCLGIGFVLGWRLKPW